jgi:hypothetical protein
MVDFVRVSENESSIAAIINRLLQQNRHIADINDAAFHVAIGGTADITLRPRNVGF